MHFPIKYQFSCCGGFTPSTSFNTTTLSRGLTRDPAPLKPLLLIESKRFCCRRLYLSTEFFEPLASLCYFTRTGQSQWNANALFTLHLGIARGCQIRNSASKKHLDVCEPRHVNQKWMKDTPTAWISLSKCHLSLAVVKRNQFYHICWLL